MLNIPPYPYVVTESSDVLLDQGWVVRPQLFFSCHLRPRAHGCREGPITRTARTTSKSNSCSTAPSSPWSCQWAALWTLWACRSCTHPHPRPFCMWPRRQCAGARALDVPVPPRQLYSDHPTPDPPVPERQVSTSAGRCSGIAADELGRKKSNVTFQRVRDQLMAVAVWAGQTASGGPVGGCD